MRVFGLFGCVDSGLGSGVRVGFFSSCYCTLYRTVRYAPLCFFCQPGPPILVQFRYYHLDLKDLNSFPSLCVFFANPFLGVLSMTIV